MVINRFVIGLALLGATALAACGGSGNSDSPEATATESVALSEAETQYLEQVAAIDATLGEKIVAIDVALSTTWPTRQRLLAVLRDADIGGTFQTMVAGAEQLEAPDVFQSDHDSYLQSLRASLPLSHDFEQALDDGDLVGVQLIRTELLLSRGRLLIETSSTFCQAALQSGVSPGCASAEPPPGGAFGAALQGIFRRYVTEFDPRVSAFPAAFTPEERFETLEALQSDIISAIEEGMESVRVVEPPAELRADNDRLIQYFEETLEVSRAISQAAEDRDFASTEEEFQRSGIVFCNAVRDLSAEVKSMISVFFQDPEGNCGMPS